MSVSRGNWTDNDFRLNPSLYDGVSCRESVINVMGIRAHNAVWKSASVFDESHPGGR